MWTILISALATLSSFLILVLIFLKRKIPVQSSASTPTPPASANPPARVSRPSMTKIPFPWGGLVLAGVMIAVAVWIYSGPSGMSQTTVAKIGPVWGEIQTLTLTDQPVVVPWPERTTGKYRTYLANPAKDKGRRYGLKSVNEETILSGEKGKKGPRIENGQPCYLRIVDNGPPFEITFEWEIQE